tara:strand:+ start:267 stop:515 length:249 start_codon:yes stop_codon:yes gene_type:complete
MPIFTSTISGSVAGEALAISGSMETTGFLSSYGFGNASTIALNTATRENYNFVLYGPVTIEGNMSLTISDSSNVKIIDISDA